MSTVTCPQCGAEAADDVQFCPRCGLARGQQAAAPVTPAAPQVIVVRSGKSAGLAAVLSFFWPGLGQIYNGQILGGLVLMVVYVLSVLSIAIMVGIVTTPILWLYGIFQAKGKADQINRRQFGG